MEKSSFPVRPLGTPKYTRKKICEHLRVLSPPIVTGIAIDIHRCNAFTVVGNLHFINGGMIGNSVSVAL